MPVYAQPVYWETHRSAACPVAESASLEVAGLPFHPALFEDELEQIVAAVRTFSLD